MSGRPAPRSPSLPRCVLAAARRPPVLITAGPPLTRCPPIAGCRELLLDASRIAKAKGVLHDGRSTPRPLSSHPISIRVRKHRARAAFNSGGIMLGVVTSGGGGGAAAQPWM